MKRIILSLLICLLILGSTGITGCNKHNISESDFYFPVVQEPLETYHLLLTAGELIYNGEYILLKNTFLSYSVEKLLIWPYGYSLDIEDGEINILNDEGQIVAAVGDTIEVGGGGEITTYAVENLIGESLPYVWEGEYWLVSKIVID